MFGRAVAAFVKLLLGRSKGRRSPFSSDAAPERASLSERAHALIGAEYRTPWHRAWKALSFTLLNLVAV